MKTSVIADETSVFKEILITLHYVTLRYVTLRYVTFELVIVVKGAAPPIDNTEFSMK